MKILNTLENINIELTNKCNLACKMCYRNNMNIAQGVMDYNLFLNIAEQVVNYNTIKSVFLHWRGEPFCCEYLDEAVKNLCASNKRVVLFTNGTMMQDKLLKNILNANITEIVFSLEANASSVYESIRGQDYFEELKSTIKRVCRVRDEICSSTKINISFVVLDENIFSVASFAAEWDAIVDKIIYKFDMRKDASFMQEKKAQCKWPLSNIFISWNGLVSPCCMDVNCEFDLGDVSLNTLEDIFHSKKRQTLLDSLESGVPIGHCQNCHLFNPTEINFKIEG